MEEIQLARRRRSTLDAAQIAPFPHRRKAREQRLGVGMPRSGDQVIRATLLDEFAAIHDRDVVAKPVNLANVVRYHQETGLTLPPQGFQKRDDLTCDRRIEACRRLVQDKDSRVIGQGQRDHDTLLHAARQLVRVAGENVFDIPDLDAVQKCGGACTPLIGRDCEQSQSLVEHRDDTPIRIKCRSRVLEDDREPLGGLEPAASDTHTADAVALDLDRTTGNDASGRQTASQCEGERRLARAPILPPGPIAWPGATRRETLRTTLRMPLPARYPIDRSSQARAALL